MVTRFPSWRPVMTTLTMPEPDWPSISVVAVVMTGRHEVKRVTIDPRLLSEEREMLEDLVAAAVNDATRRVEAMTQEKMAGVTAGLPLPPGMKLPF